MRLGRKMKPMRPSHRYDIVTKGANVGPTYHASSVRLHAPPNPTSVR